MSLNDVHGHVRTRSDEQPTGDFRSFSEISHRSDDGHPENVLRFQGTREASQRLKISLVCRQ